MFFSRSVPLPFTCLSMPGKRGKITRFFHETFPSCAAGTRNSTNSIVPVENGWKRIEKHVIIKFLFYKKLVHIFLESGVKMGLFLSILLIPGQTEQTVAPVLKRLGVAHPDWDLNLNECAYQAAERGLTVQLNDHCAGYEEIPQTLSQALDTTALLCYIYDDDFWGYFLYQNGQELDVFQAMPDYFEEPSPQKRARLAGNSAVLSQAFGVDASRVEQYLQTWTEEIVESEEEQRAYPEDEACIGDCWQMTDFMAALGYPYTW